jgi:hypothetical protein
VLLRKGEHEIETPSRGEGKRTDTLPPGERMVKAMPQKVERNPEALSRKRELKRPEALPPDGERERGTTPQGNPNEGALVAWDPGEKPAGEDTVDSKGPVEAMGIAAGIDAPQRNVTPGIVTHKKIPGCTEVVSVFQHHPKEPTTYLYPFFLRPIPPIRKTPCLLFGAFSTFFMLFMKNVEKA